MLKKLLLYFSFFSFLITAHAQGTKESVQLNLGSNSHELYVCFDETIQFNGVNYLKVLLTSIPEIKAINKEFHLEFEKGITISDEKLAFMETEAIRISKSGASVRKLRNILKVRIENPTSERLNVLASKLEKLSQVEYCDMMSLEPTAPPTDIAPTTTNYEAAQTYIFANPGVNMKYAWDMGLIGTGIRVRDVEYGFNKNHEELFERNASVATGMTISTDASISYTEHGTAVFGIVYADKGSYGVSGMAYGAQEMVLFPEWQQTGYSRVNAVSQAIANSTAGDVVIYEMQAEGRPGGSPAYYVPAEFQLTIWNLTKAATDAGIIIIAAAGNGNEDLDSANYTAYMNRGNSGAIIIGAGSADVNHNKMTFSTYGSRVDVQGWGSNVRSSGYGNYSSFGGDFNQYYTNFSGTSSATPIVASCAIVLQSYFHSITGSYMTSTEMRNLLIATGIAQGSGGHIGPIPNMQAAITQMSATLSNQENAGLIGFNVYPNPAKDRITINIQETAKVEISNAVGQKVYASDITMGNNEISLARFQSGLYFVKVSNGGKTAVRKIIKE